MTDENETVVGEDEATGGRPLMTMETLGEAHDYIVVDGAPYDLARDADLSLRQRGRMMTLQRRYMRILTVDTDELEEGEIAAGEAALLELMGILLPTCPRAVAEAMHTSHRLAVVNLFTAPQQAIAMQAMLAPMLREMAPSIGDGSSRGARRRTAPPEEVGADG